MNRRRTYSHLCRVPAPRLRDAGVSVRQVPLRFAGYVEIVLYWDEQNRLQGVRDDGHLSFYQYDAGGDRTYKLPYLKTYSNRSGRRSVYWAPEHSTLYASPYLVVTPQGYTKHYYAESERITSQIGRGNFSTLATPVTDTATANRKVRRADSLVLVLNPSITDTAAQLSYLTALTNRQKDTCEAYWYHTDHLGSSSWITDSAGNPVQHLHYLPWGEDYVNQRLNDFDGVRYTFSAKEKDAETGYSYFGSRYYNSDLSIWLSVDPKSDKYPGVSPYVYCADNPVKLVDPNGEEFSNPDDPPKRNFFQKIGDGFVKFDKSLEGHSDGANQGTITKQDVEVGVAVAATMMSAGAALEAETAFKTTVAIVSAVNSVDDATVNSSGQTVLQKAAANNKTASNTVKVGKTLVSAASVGVSANDVRKVVVEATKKGTQVIKKKASTIAKNVVSAATSVYGAVTSLFKKKK